MKYDRLEPLRATNQHVGRGSIAKHPNQLLLSNLWILDFNLTDIVLSVSKHIRRNLLGTDRSICMESDRLACRAGDSNFNNFSMNDLRNKNSCIHRFPHQHDSYSTFSCTLN